MTAKRARLTEDVLRQAAVEWLEGKSWRRLTAKYQAHPKYLAGQAKKLGYMTPDTIRSCPKCHAPKVLTEFTRAGASGKEAVMHDCNACERVVIEQRKSPHRSFLPEQLDVLRVRSLIHAEGYLARVRAKVEAAEASEAAA